MITISRTVALGRLVGVIVRCGQLHCDKTTWEEKVLRAAYLGNGALLNACRCCIGRDISCRDDGRNASAQRHRRTRYSDSPGEHCGLSRCFVRKGKMGGRKVGARNVLGIEMLSYGFCANSPGSPQFSGQSKDTCLGTYRFLLVARTKESRSTTESIVVEIVGDYKYLKSALYHCHFMMRANGH